MVVKEVQLTKVAGNVEVETEVGGNGNRNGRELSKATSSKITCELVVDDLSSSFPAGRLAHGR